MSFNEREYTERLYSTRILNLLNSNSAKKLAMLSVFLIVIGMSLLIPSYDSSPCQTRQLREAMEIATKFRREGDMSLDIYLKDAIKDEFTQGDLSLFYKLADAAERRKIVDSFKKDTFQFMDKDGISHTFPDGYIKR